MGLRDKLNANQNAVAVGAVVIIAVALIYIFMHLGGSSARAGTGQSWYYDAVKDSYFVGKADQFPPITSPDGNPAVRAHYFSCSDCSSKKDRFVGFYDKFTDEAKQKLEAARDNPNPNPENSMGMEMYYENGVLFSLDAKTWFPSSDMQYQEALQQKLNCTNGGRAKYCQAK